MLNKIKELIIEVEKFQTDSAESVEQFRIKFLGKKGILNDLFLAFKDVPNQEKKAFGQNLNELKTKAQEKVDALKDSLEQKEESAALKELILYDCLMLVRKCVKFKKGNN